MPILAPVDRTEGAAPGEAACAGFAAPAVVAELVVDRIDDATAAELWTVDVGATGWAGGIVSV